MSTSAITPYFVSPAGNDAWSGRLAEPDTAGTDGPFASLERARDALRADGTGKPRAVILRGGVYRAAATLSLGPEDSGTEEAPVVWKAAPGEDVRLLGGQALSGFEPVSDPAVLDRLDPVARDHVLQVDLRAQGVVDFGRFRSRGFGRPATPSHLELFFCGAPMTVAQWPNVGEWDTIAGFPAEAALPDGHGESFGSVEGGFTIAGDRHRRWRSLDDVWIHGYWAWDWANSYEHLVSLDRNTGLVKTAAPFGLYGFREGQRICFINLLEELDQPGEWYLDRSAGLLYFWPPSPVDSGEVLVSVLESPVFSLNDASHITLQGLGIEAVRGTAVTVRGGRNVRIAGCRMRLIGNWAVSIDGGTYHSVVSCDIEETGDGGLTVAGGDRNTLTPAVHLVENCHFRKLGRWSRCGVPAILIGGVGIRAAHNLIHNHPHCPILFSGNEHEIEFNEIHHVALETGDVGAIYFGRDWTYRGNRIRFNFVHHTGGVGMGSMGVYLDDCVSGAEIYGNVFYKVTRAVMIGGGRDHRVENNVFVDCDPAIHFDGRGVDDLPVWHDMVYDTMRKRLEEVPRALYLERYPAIAALDRHYAADGGVPPEGNVVARNICVGGNWAKIYWNATPEMLEQEGNYEGPDPGFVSVKNMDFALRADSPVWATGFRPIPFEQIGLYADEFRSELPAADCREASVEGNLAGG